MSAVRDAISHRLVYGKLLDSQGVVSQHIPYSVLMSPTVVATQDCALISVCEVKGVPFETTGNLTLNDWNQTWAALIKRYQRPGIVFQVTTIRRRLSQSRPQIDTGKRFVQLLDQAYVKACSEENQYETVHYISVIVSPNEGLRGLFGAIKGPRGDRHAQMKVLSEITDALTVGLSEYGIRLLGTQSSNRGQRSELLEFLCYLINGEQQPLIAPRTALSKALGMNHIIFGSDTAEIKLSTGPLFFKCLSVKLYPSATRANLLDGLLSLDVAFIVTHIYECYDQGKALQTLRIQQHQLETSNDPAHSLISELDDAADDASANRIGLGAHTFIIKVMHSDVKALPNQIQAVIKVLSQAGFVPVVEGFGLEAAHWVQLPGNLDYRGRKSDIHHFNFAQLAPLRGTPSGHPSFNQWGGATAVFKTLSHSLYYFQFHHRPTQAHEFIDDERGYQVNMDESRLGNTVVIGPSGSGKTVALTFLLAMSERHRSKVVFFDKDQGAMPFIYAMHGRYYTLKNGQSTHLNPFIWLPKGMAKQDQAKALQRELLEVMVQEEGIPLNSAEKQEVARVIDELWQLPVLSRSLSHMQSLFSHGAGATLSDRFNAWHGDGAMAWVFDHAQEDLSLDSTHIGIDLTEILEVPRAKAVILRYLFSRVDELIDGHPTLITLDEGWKACEDEGVAQRVKDWEKTIRKRNGVVIFGTQSARDLMRTRIGDTIIEQSPNQLFFPNHQADEQSHCIDGFALSPKEFDWIKAGLSQHPYSFLLRQGNRSVVVKLDLSKCSALIRVLSGTTHHNERLLALIDERGSDPTQWLHDYLYHD